MPSKRAANSSAPGKKIQKQTKSLKTDTCDVKKTYKKDDESAPESSESKMTLCTVPTISTKPTRRPGRSPSGKSCIAQINRSRDMSAKVRSAYRRNLDPCDNSNDSGIGSFDNHMDPSHHHNMGIAERLNNWNVDRPEPKRPKLDIKVENDEANDSYSFGEPPVGCKETTSLIRTAPSRSIPPLTIENTTATTTGRAVPRCVPLTSRQASSGPIPLTGQLLSMSRYMDISLTIVKQPEQQHRARYQTEGSRGAVKDREGNGFPVVQLNGYYKPATLQVFIGTDEGKVSPHMFYQACKVSGKNSTPCVEKKIDGTCVIELQLEPSKEMSATCDCVGILKERNVDVEHRFPDQLGNRNKKKSTRCRMIFRTTLTFDDGTQETLQVCSQPIVCTQPPGVPEICKKSLTSCPASGGLELFVLGKNFLKDTQVFFQQFEDGHVHWEQAVVPDKEYLQQTHFVCVIPQYRRPDITEPVTVRLCVVSSGKTSESHQFVYTPVNGAVASVHVDPPQPAQPPSFLRSTFWQAPLSIRKKEEDLDMMPPPESNMVPLASRRPSIGVPSTSNDGHSPTFKQEYIDENSQGSIIESDRYRHISESSLDVHHGDSNMSIINENTIENSILSHINENSNISVGKEDNVEVMVHRNSMSHPSITNDESVEMIMRRNSLSRHVSICENSVECNSNMATINEETTCDTILRSVDGESVPSGLLTTASTIEKVMDLRMKMPMATVADLVNTTAPSIAALQRFGINLDNSAGPLPTQSIQSVENYLTKIETKPSLIPMTNPTSMLMKNDLSEKLSQIMNGEQGLFHPQKMSPQMSPLIGPEPVFLSSARSTQNEVMNIVAKSESADIPDHSVAEQTNTIASSTITTMSTSIERSVPTPINTEKLDALVNSTVESHLSPTRSDTSVKDSIINMSTDTIISTQDVMLNNTSSLMVPPLINTRMSSPVLEMTNASPNLTPEVILNSQISPSLMCRNICPVTTTVESTLLPTTINSQQLVPDTTQTMAVALTSEPENAVLLKAAADLIETQKKISEMGTLPSTTKCNILMTTTHNETMNMQSSRSNFVQSHFPTSIVSKEQKTEFELPLGIKDITSGDKKNEDRMIPQSFTSLTENELINLINPSCFDQGNNINNFQ